VRRRMATIADGFRALILREFYLEPRLPDEFKAASWINWFGNTVSKPASYIVAAKFGIPPQIVEKPVRFICGLQNATWVVRAFSDWLASLKSSRNNYESCCRSALCYAITNAPEWAFGALRKAASRNDSWARHHHIYGLIHGERGDFERAAFELGKALGVEPYQDVRARIEEAMHLVSLGSKYATEASGCEAVQGLACEELSETLQAILELIGQVRDDGPASHTDKGGELQE
jgi:hypothetical protein